MINVIEMVRVSTELQAGEDRGGIQAQRQANQETAKRFGLKIVESIEIIDVSGSNVLETPEMQHLLVRIADPDINGLVAKEFSRLIRPEGYTHYLLFEAFLRHGIVVYVPSGPIDLASDQGALMGPVHAWMAGQERRQILARMNDGKEALRKQGRHPGGESTLPFGVGYDPKTGKWSYTPEASKVSALFTMFLGGETNYQELARQSGLPRTNVRYFLSNPIYSGWRVYDSRRDPSPNGLKPGIDGRQGERRKIKREEARIVRVQVIAEPLVNPADFAAVQAVIERKREHNWRSRTSRPSAYVYNGHLGCGDCGSPLYTHKSKQDFYICKARQTRGRRQRAAEGRAPCGNRYMLRAKLEARLDQIIASLAQDRGFLGELLTHTDTRIQQPAARSAGPMARLHIKQLQKQRSRLIDMCAKGLISTEEFRQRSIALDAEIARAEKKPATPVRAERESIQAQLEMVLLPFTDWEFLGREDKRTLLNALAPRFAISKYSVKQVELPLYPAANGRYIDSRRKMATSPSRAPRCR